MNVLLDYYSTFPTGALMDFAGIAAAIVALTGLVAAVWKIWSDQKTMKIDNAIVWKGRIGRGFVEAMKCEYMKMENGRWSISDEARMHYADKIVDLRDLYNELAKRFKRPPTAAEFGWTVEHTPSLQTWMLERICPQLLMYELGCLAIAYVLAEQHSWEIAA